MFPLSIGFFLLACAVITARGRELPQTLQRQLVIGAGSTLALINVVAFLANLHRYVNGSQGPRTHLAENAWLPPVPLVALILGFVASYAAFTWIVLRSTSEASESPAERAPAPDGR